MRHAKYTIAGLVAMVGIGLVLVSTSLPSSASSSGECQEPVPGAPNASILDASTEWAEVLGTTQLNGTKGFVTFKNIPTDENHTLVGPNGYETITINPLDGRVTFPNVSLCNTGTWELLNNDTKETVSLFNVTTDASEIGSSTFAVDADVSTVDEKDYKAGDLYAELVYKDGYPSGAAQAKWTGDTTPPGYSLTDPSKVRFHADWEGYAEHGEGYVQFWVCSQTEPEPLGLESERVCNYHLVFGIPVWTDSACPCTKTGTLNVTVAWKAGGAYDAEIGAAAVPYHSPFNYFTDQWDRVGRTVLPQT